MVGYNPRSKHKSCFTGLQMEAKENVQPSDGTSILHSPSEIHCGTSLSRSRSIKLDIIRQLSLLSSQITSIPSLSSINLDAQYFGRQFENLVLYFAILHKRTLAYSLFADLFLAQTIGKSVRTCSAVAASPVAALTAALKAPVSASSATSCTPLMIVKSLALTPAKLV